MTDDDYNRRLNELTSAAAALLRLGTERFRAGRPAEAAALAAAHAEGGVEFGVTVRLMPAVAVECWAAHTDGARLTFATLHAREVLPDRARFN